MVRYVPMPADTLTISLTGPLADEVRAAAEARGLTPEEYVREVMAAESEYNNLSWEEDIRRLEEPGDSIPVDQVFDELHAKIVAARAEAKTK